MASTNHTTSTFRSTMSGGNGSTTFASDTERFSASSDGIDLETYLFLGRKYLDFKLTKQILTAASGNQLIDIESVLSQRLSGFPWQSAYNAISALVNNGVGRDLPAMCGGSMKRAYLVAVGMILMSNTRSSRTKLSDSLGNNQPAGGAHYQPSSISSNTTANPIPRLDTPIDTRPEVPSDDDMLPLYSMALNEYCQRQGITMRYGTGKKISLDPPWWQSSVKCGGDEWIAEAKNKAKAKHKAAKTACLALRIQAW